jgi:hypothetical protein
MRTLFSILFTTTITAVAFAQGAPAAPVSGLTTPSQNIGVRTQPQSPSIVVITKAPSTLTGGPQVIIPKPTLDPIIVPRVGPKPPRTGP